MRSARYAARASWPGGQDRLGVNQGGYRAGLRDRRLSDLTQDNALYLPRAKRHLDQMACPNFSCQLCREMVVKDLRDLRDVNCNLYVGWHE